MKKNAKRLLCAVMCAAMVLALTPSVFALKNGDVVDSVLHTDIVTYINDKPIESYNIKGYTAIKVEDLMNYGFDVRWNSAERTLKVTRPAGKAVVGGYTVVPNTYPVGSYWMDVYYTDIKTYFDNTEVPSYNIGGMTIAYVDDLAEHYAAPGKYNWNASARTLSMTLIGGTTASGSGSNTATPAPTPTPTPTPTPAALAFALQPTSVSATANTAVSFKVAVTGGTAPYSYKWELRTSSELTWTDAECSDATYSFTATQAILDKNYMFRCTVTDSAGTKITSEIAQLTGKAAAVPLSIILDPADQVADTLYTTLTFSVAAQGGTPAYKYEWQISKDGINWYTTGVNNLQTYSLAVTADLISSITYVRCLVTDSIGVMAVSKAAKIVGIAAGGSTEPLVVTGKWSESGNIITFAATATGGAGGYKYQWYRVISSLEFIEDGQTSSTMQMNAGDTYGTWTFRCYVTDSAGNKAFVDIQCKREAKELQASLNYSGNVKLNGGSVTLKVTVTGGKAPYTLQWQFYNETAVWGWQANTWYKVWSDASLNTETLTRDTENKYRCKVTDADGNVTYTNEVTLVP